MGSVGGGDALARNDSAWVRDARILAIIPAYNEEENIAAVVRGLSDLGMCDVLVVNDGSSDNTCAEARRAGADYLDLPCNLGIGGAVQAGFRYALANGYDVAFQFDGDGQHDANYVRAIAEPVLKGDADLAVGSRFLGGENEFMSTAARRAGIRLLSAVLKASTGFHIRDVTSGFRAAGKRCIALFARDYPIDYPEPESLAMALAQGMRVLEVPVSMRARSGGVSSIRGFEPIYYMVKVGIAVAVAARGARKAACSPAAQDSLDDVAGSSRKEGE